MAGLGILHYPVHTNKNSTDYFIIFETHHALCQQDKNNESQIQSWDQISQKLSCGIKTLSVLFLFGGTTQLQAIMLEITRCNKAKKL